MLQRFYQEKYLEAGCDEAGRGCLAGPVFAAAVILPKNFYQERLNDSKQLSLQNRVWLRQKIEREALGYGVAQIDHAEIDRINILQASIEAMHRAVDQLEPVPGFLIIDGNQFRPYAQIPHCCLIRGDARFAAIAAASVLAKTYRDDFMEQLHQQYPEYGWKKNKGYPTLQHREAIRKYGLSPYHRKSFRLLPQIIP
ncbi:MAG: ribonuclease HII [Chitinophagaceae bacterium]